jgi:hypothetical protein
MGTEVRECQKEKRVAQGQSHQAGEHEETLRLERGVAEARDGQADEEEQGAEGAFEEVDSPCADLARVAAIEGEAHRPACGGAQGCNLSQRKAHCRANRLTPVSRERAPGVGWGTD